LIERNVFVSSRISEKKFLKHFANVYDDDDAERGALFPVVGRYSSNPSAQRVTLMTPLLP